MTTHSSKSSTASSPKLFPEIEAFLERLGIRAVDSDFATLQQFIQDAVHNGQGAPEATPPPRWQDQVIEKLVKNGSSVLDVGCGEGDLLVRLAEKRRAKVQAVELNQELVIRCIERGIPIYHGDLEKSLRTFGDNAFDYVILEETLQTLQHPLDALRELLRIGRHVIVSFPNFAHWKVRLAFSLGGRMPKTASLPNTWYNTPNIHLCSINDFMDWTSMDHVRIEDSYVLCGGKIEEYRPEHNLAAEQALFMVERGA